MKIANHCFVIPNPALRGKLQEESVPTMQEEKHWVGSRASPTVQVPEALEGTFKITHLQIS